MIVVTGATGNIGRPLVRALVAAGEDVTAVSRRPAEFEGAVHRQADLADPESLRPVLEGADALLLLLVSGDELDGPAIMAVARSAGVRRVVMVSSLGARTRPESFTHSRLLAFEAAVQESGLDWTVLRPNGFDSNAYLWAEAVRTGRTVTAAFGDVGLPHIDPVDIAEVAAAALRGDGHAGRTYELTGPALVTPRQQARALGDALGEPVTFVELTRAEARERFLRFVPEGAVDGTLDILGAPTPAEQNLSPDVERVLGRAPRSFADWATANIAAFR